ncbi:MAG TPA: S46 family peptidase [Pirellulales bacterium]|nr:S46 family peptidase [Pirellulales bacterium]
MRKRNLHWPALLAATTLGLICLQFAPAALQADEGMWLFNQPPRKILKERYGFEPTDEWLTRLQQSSVRFNSGGSGSFVSAGGLVMTNHHVGADALQKLSTPEHNYLHDGFYAAKQEDEIKCVDLELNVLVSIEDVTHQVQDAVKGLSAADARAARRAAMNTIEEESRKKTGLRSDVITLYHGGLYHLYRFKKYTDVRLVFAPEKSVAFFGGDADNFEYPRYDLDICFFRAYEDGKPAEPEHHLSWSQAGAGDGELIFVSGHPGRTNRLDTVVHLEFIRDKVYPLSLNVIRRREVMLRNFSERSRENARRAEDELFGYQNSRKARLGGLAGLQDPAIMADKRQRERQLQQSVRADRKLADSYGDAWEEVAAAIREWGDIYDDWYLLENGVAFNSELYHIARTIVRLTEESEKPNAERLREYSEAGLESLKQHLFSEAPIYADLETVKLADSLGMLQELLGARRDLVQRVMADQSPAERAAQLVQGTQLADVEVRRKLAAGGRKAVEASNDPMIQLARLIDGPARTVRKIYEEQVDEPQKQAYGKIAQAQFALYGDNQYPDATFTLRLAFGPVKGYRQQGQEIAPWTVIGGAYKHAAEHGNVEPFKLPESWEARKRDLDLDTPFNFVSTADIIGGNSGSPVVNRAGELVGIIFDGNIQSLVLDFAYSDEQARAVSVHSSAILEALRKVYRTERLLKELQR